MTTAISDPVPASPAMPAEQAISQSTTIASPQLAEELGRLETDEQQIRDRQREEELARLRELARFD